jgi:ADP-ribose pyrophosphatase
VFFVNEDRDGLGDERLVEERLESGTVYEGRILSLTLDKVRLPDGRSASREVVRHKRAVVVLAESAGGEILMIRQFRYPAGEVMLELPAGIVEPGEAPEDAASRELREETGWKPAMVEKIGEFFTSPGFTDELLTMYWARGIERGKLPQDDDEFIVPCFLSRSEALVLAESGRIRDLKSLFGVYWWLTRPGPGTAGGPESPPRQRGDA